MPENKPCLLHTGSVSANHRVHKKSFLGTHLLDNVALPAFRLGAGSGQVSLERRRAEADSLDRDVLHLCKPIRVPDQDFSVSHFRFLKPLSISSVMPERKQNFSILSF